MRPAWAKLYTIAAAVLCAALGILLPWWLIGACLIVFLAWLGLTRPGRQAALITAAGLATLPRRLGGASVVVLGVAGVVGVLVALLAMGRGYQAMLEATGSNDTAIVLGIGSQDGELGSVLSRGSAMIIANEPQVMRGADGRPVASAELLVTASVPMKEGGRYGEVAIRGVGPQAWVIHKNVRIIAGRRFTPGLRELIAGENVRREFADVEVGSTVEINGEPWKVVGAFDAHDAHNSELWGDIDVLGPAFGRGSSITSMTVRLRNPRLFRSFKAALASDPRLKVETQTTRAFYASQARGLTESIRMLGILVASIMAIGSVAGALNSMYTAVSARTREIATLRAIGFSGELVLLSVMIETTLLAVAGGVMGAGVTWIFFDHYTAATLGPDFTELMFQFRVTPGLLVTGLRCALAIGIVGGVLPALRAGQASVAAGIRLA